MITVSHFVLPVLCTRDHFSILAGGDVPHYGLRYGQRKRGSFQQHLLWWLSEATGHWQDARIIAPIQGPWLAFLRHFGWHHQGQRASSWRSVSQNAPFAVNAE